MDDTIFDNFAGLLSVLVIVPLVYMYLVVLLRLSGKRTLAQLNAFDLIVTVALGSTPATIAFSDSVALAEGALTLVLLGSVQFLAAWSAVRLSWVRRALTSEPALLVRDGQPITPALIRERILGEGLGQVVRSAGLWALERLAAVVADANGTVSVITQDELGSGSVLQDVRGWR